MLLTGSIIVIVFVCAILSRAVKFLRGKNNGIDGHRPPFATLLCLWLLAAPIIAVAGHYSAKATHILHPDRYYHPSSPFELGLTVLSCVLAVAAGVALWRMSFLAFHLFVLRLALGVLQTIVFDVARSHELAMIQGPDARLALYASHLALLVLGAAITRYVYNITFSGNSRVRESMV
jgi:hypothetical protein